MYGKIARRKVKESRKYIHKKSRTEIKFPMPVHLCCIIVVPLMQSSHSNTVFSKSFQRYVLK